MMTATDLGDYLLAAQVWKVALASSRATAY
jgi:hypothetical protein